MRAVNAAETKFLPADGRKRLAPATRLCHGRRMYGRDPGFSRGGGSLLAGAIIAGAVAGAVTGELSIGILAGFGIGVLIALAV